MPVAGHGEHWGYAESGVFTIYAVSTGLNCEKSREQRHIPADDAAKDKIGVLALFENLRF